MYVRHNKILEDIYAVIYYRIYVHDAGFEKVIEAYGAGRGTIAAACRKGLQRLSALPSAAEK